jgi:ATP-binding cassette, subfamily F, member 3
MLTASNISKLAGNAPLFSNASFQIYEGEKVGLVGPNGAGKTTLFRMIVGEEQPDSGAISVQNNVRIAYFSQKVGEMKGRGALEEVISGNAQVAALAKRLKGYEDSLCDPKLDPLAMETILEKMGEDQTAFEKLGGFEIETNAQVILTGLGIAPSDHAKPVEDFSSGWKMRIALAKVLIVLPDLILMDEPTNYLDLETILWLESWLNNFKGAVFMTTHDRDFMNRVVRKIVEIDGGSVTTFSGNYDFYEQEKSIRRGQNESQYNRQQSMLKKENAFIARFKARASHAAQVQSRVKMLEKIDRVELMTESDAMSVLLPEIPRGGNDVITVKSLAKSWKNSDGSDKPVFAGLSAVVRRQDAIAVVGVNGAGKSTFLKVLCGLTPPTSGEVFVGASIAIGYFGQHTIESLDADATVFDTVRAKLPLEKDNVIRNLLASFLFKGDEVFKKIKILSGGEKTRVILAYLLSLPYNCLILDEPTNHLDIKSREVLLDVLERYQGTVLLVSHDRYFLRAITNRVFEVDHGRINVVEGDYQRYLDEKNAPNPQRR